MKNTVLKCNIMRVITVVIIASTILVLSGCGNLADSLYDSGEEACRAYLDCLASSNFEGCFNFVAPRQARDTQDQENVDKDILKTVWNSYVPDIPFPTNDAGADKDVVLPEIDQELHGIVIERAKELQNDSLYMQYTYQSISLDEFISKYELFYEVFNIDNISIDNVSVKEGVYLTQLKYTLTYHSQLAGDIINEYNISFTSDYVGNWTFAWTPALILPQMDWGDGIYSVALAPNRGEIVMNNGGILAQNINLLSVNVDTSIVSDINQFSNDLALLLDIDSDNLEKRIRAASGGEIIVATIFPLEYDQIESELLAYECVNVTQSGQVGRYYPHGDTLAHIVGYAGYASDDELKKLNEELPEGEEKYTSGSIIGKSGLELKYESELRGTSGYNLILKGYDGRVKDTLYTKLAQDGIDIKLTIDSELQLRLEEVLQNVVFGEDTSAAVVVMNPKTGFIDAMASYPAYDLNNYAIGITPEQLEAYQNDPREPLINKVTRGQYPPGSTFKCFTAALGIMRNVVDEDYVFTGKIVDNVWIPTQYGEWTWPGIRRADFTVRYDPLNMRNALVQSDNIYFANLTLMIGRDTFLDYMEQIGMSETIPFELSMGESSAYACEPEDIYLRMLADMGYGQAQMLVTPLQLACMFGAFRNNGDIMVPQIVQGLYESVGNDYIITRATNAEVWKEDIVSQYAIDILTPMLEDVVDPNYNGTGRPLRVTTYKVAGKTGTAEMDLAKTRETSWIVAYRVDVSPEDERLVLVMIDMPNDDIYTNLKFEIARAMLE